MWVETQSDASTRNRIALNGPTMGSRWTALFNAPESFNVYELRAELQAAVDRVDDQMSTWKPKSDLNRLNAAPVGVWVDVPTEMMAVLEAALDVGKASDGAFDIGVGDLVKAWGFGGGNRRPDTAAIENLEGRPTFAPPKTLLLDKAGKRARKLAPLSLDLSGIAKGFGVDMMNALMQARCIKNWLVGIDGELRANGKQADGSPWTIAIEKPSPESREICGVLELEDSAVATSGNYRHFRTHKGRHASHTMNPHTGAPLDSDLTSVTVLADTCMMADAWATAIMVSGRKIGLAMAQKLELPVVLIDQTGEMFSTI